MKAGCGKCLNCKRRRITEWSFRLMQEKQRSQSAIFVTLTYGTHSVPITNNGFMSLKKKDLQDFFKRLRYHEKEDVSITQEDNKRKWKKTTIKYYACGEYGDQRKRPHYHAIIFNIRNSQNISKAWADLGSTHVDTNVNNNNIDYTIKYLDKVSKIGKFKNDDRLKEFSLMSKNIGGNYLTKENVDHHRNNINLNYLVNDRGFKVTIPKYYQNQIYKVKMEKQDGSTVYINSKLGNELVAYVKDRVEEKEKKDKIECEKQGVSYEEIEQKKKYARQQRLKNQIKSRNVD